MMFRTALICAGLAALTACAPRGEIAFGAPVPQASVHDIWIANFRATAPPAAGNRSPPRPSKLTFEMAEVSVPASHATGQIEWPKGVPNAATDFVTLSSETFKSPTHFAQALAQSDKAVTRETFVYVHGYNYTHGEAVYQAAQIVHDYEVPSPMVLFSWPSAALPVGYLYDRDSALIARDRLEEVLIALTRQPGRKVTLLGHSMGNLLIMETLRQIELSGSLDIAQKIDAFIMVSPDIDGELFYTQARRIGRLPNRTVIIAARQDSALRLSARLTGRENRLGSATDRRAVRDLPVVVIDASDLADGGNNHSIGLTSPAAIAILKNVDPDSLPGELQEQTAIKLVDLR